MISVMVSKWVGDAWSKEGIYSRWIALRNYPWLSTSEYNDKGETAANFMVPYDKLVVINSENTSTADAGLCPLLIAQTVTEKKIKDA